MLKLNRNTRAASILAALPLGSGAAGTRLALMAGEAKVGVIAGIAVIGAAAGFAPDIWKSWRFAKVEAVEARAAAKARAVARMHVDAAGTPGILAEYSAQQAREVLNATARETFDANPELMSRSNFPDLFRRYPNLAAARANAATWDEFLRSSPGFLEDASVELYRRDPALFAKRFNESPFLLADDFVAVVHKRVTTQNEDSVRKILSSVATSLEKQGFPATKLAGMEEEVLEQVVSKALSQEIERQLKGTAWAYKSGTLTVKGQIGHFEYEQAVSISGLAKAIALGSIAVSGYKIAWSKDAFTQVQHCIGDFCFSIVQSTEMTGPAGGMKIGRAPNP